jgi:signal peptidase I
MFFALGDNRDNSVDSRLPGFVPVANVLGSVEDRWFSMDPCTGLFRCSRLGSIRWFSRPNRCC